MSFKELLTQKLGAYCVLDAPRLDRLEGHYRLLLRWNDKIKLTSIRGIEAIVVRHYCESLYLGSRLPADPVSVVDVGSGAGFPGIPMAVLRPDCRFALVESNRRKAVFLREATRALENVHIFCERAERLDAHYDWMVSRAVCWRDLPRLGTTVALLLGEADARSAVIPGVRWRERHRLPWGERRVLLIGS